MANQLKKLVVLTTLSLAAMQSHAWGFFTGKVDVYHVNTYGNFSESYLNGGYCFKLADFSYYFKIAFSDSGEKKNNMLLVQSMVLSAYMSGRQLKVTYVDWGTDTSCRVNGNSEPAKWLENLQMLN